VEFKGGSTDKKQGLQVRVNTKRQKRPHEEIEAVPENVVSRRLQAEGEKGMGS